VTGTIEGACLCPSVGELRWTVIYRESGKEHPSYERTQSRREAFNLYDRLVQRREVFNIAIWETTCVMTWRRED
jgi:hypothetical protein